MRRTAALVLVVAIPPPPNKRSLSVKAIVCRLIFFLIHSGCATSGNIPGILPTPPSFEERALFGPVGVVQACYLALGSKNGGSDPPLKLIMDARSRLIRARDGTVVNVARFRHTGSHRRFAEWAADNAALLNREYEDGIRKLALAVVNWNFPGETGMEWPAYTIVVPEK